MARLVAASGGAGWLPCSSWAGPGLETLGYPLRELLVHHLAAPLRKVAGLPPGVVKALSTHPERAGVGTDLNPSARRFKRGVDG